MRGDLGNLHGPENWRGCAVWTECTLRRRTDLFGLAKTVAIDDKSPSACAHPEWQFRKGSQWQAIRQSAVTIV
jgi:hypothetical protein